MKQLGSSLEIVFLEPETTHPNSDSATIYDVAVFIERKYHLIELFTKHIEEAMLEKIADTALVFTQKSKDSFDVNTFQAVITSWLQAEWREWIAHQTHKIHTAAATKDGREAFIDTGAYFKSLQVGVEWHN